MNRNQPLVRALIPEAPVTVDQACERLVTGFPGAVLTSWLREFGYVNLDNTTTLSALKRAVEERGPRIMYELVAFRERGRV
jgi:hypothetical protein